FPRGGKGTAVGFPAVYGGDDGGKLGFLGHSPLSGNSRSNSTEHHQDGGTHRRPRHVSVRTHRCRHPELLPRCPFRIVVEKLRGRTAMRQYVIDNILAMAGECQ